MPEPRIPTPEQVRRMPVDSVRALRKALTDAGLVVIPGGTHLRVTDADGVFLATMPHAPSDWRSLLNSRAQIARRLGEIANPSLRRKS